MLTEWKNPFVLAPLAGVTDSAFRRVCFEQGAAMAFTEMVSAKGLYYRNANTVQYRFKRIKDVLGVDITANTVVPGLMMALAVYRIENEVKSF